MMHKARSMALKPGVFTDWPWKSLGSFKVLLLLFSFVGVIAKEPTAQNSHYNPNHQWPL